MAFFQDNLGKLVQ